MYFFANHYIINCNISDGEAKEDDDNNQQGCVNYTDMGLAMERLVVSTHRGRPKDMLNRVFHRYLSSGGVEPLWDDTPNTSEKGFRQIRSRSQDTHLDTAGSLPVNVSSSKRPDKNRGLDKQMSQDSSLVVNMSEAGSVKSNNEVQDEFSPEIPLAARIPSRPICKDIQSSSVKVAFDFSNPDSAGQKSSNVQKGFDRNSEFGKRLGEMQNESNFGGAIHFTPQRPDSSHAVGENVIPKSPDMREILMSTPKNNTAAASNNGQLKLVTPVKESTSVISPRHTPLNNHNKQASFLVFSKASRLNKSTGRTPRKRLASAFQAGTMSQQEEWSSEWQCDEDRVGEVKVDKDIVFNFSSPQKNHRQFSPRKLDDQDIGFLRNLNSSLNSTRSSSMLDSPSVVKNLNATLLSEAGLEVSTLVGHRKPENDGGSNAKRLAQPPAASTLERGQMKSVKETARYKFDYMSTRKSKKKRLRVNWYSDKVNQSKAILNNRAGGDQLALPKGSPVKRVKHKVLSPRKTRAKQRTAKSVYSFKSGFSTRLFLLRQKKRRKGACLCHKHWSDSQTSRSRSSSKSPMKKSKSATKSRSVSCPKKQSPKHRVKDKSPVSPGKEINLRSPGKKGTVSASENISGRTSPSKVKKLVTVRASLEQKSVITSLNTNSSNTSKKQARSLSCTPKKTPPKTTSLQRNRSSVSGTELTDEHLTSAQKHTAIRQRCSVRVQKLSPSHFTAVKSFVKKRPAKSKSHKETQNDKVSANERLVEQSEHPSPRNSRKKSPAKNTVRLTPSKLKSVNRQLFKNDERSSVKDRLSTGASENIANTSSVAEPIVTKQVVRKKFRYLIRNNPVYVSSRVQSDKMKARRENTITERSKIKKGKVCHTRLSSSKIKPLCKKTVTTRKRTRSMTGLDNTDTKPAISTEGVKDNGTTTTRLVEVKETPPSKRQRYQSETKGNSLLKRLDIQNVSNEKLCAMFTPTKTRSSSSSTSSVCSHYSSVSEHTDKQVQEGVGLKYDMKRNKVVVSQNKQRNSSVSGLRNFNWGKSTLGHQKQREISVSGKSRMLKKSRRLVSSQSQRNSVKRNASSGRSNRLRRNAGKGKSVNNGADTKQMSISLSPLSPSRIENIRQNDSTLNTAQSEARTQKLPKKNQSKVMKARNRPMLVGRSNLRSGPISKSGIT